MTNKKPHNSLTASWNGRSREWGKIRGNRITYPLIFMTSSNITFALSFTLPLFFLSCRAIPPGSSSFSLKHILFQVHPLSPFPFSPIHQLHRRFTSVRSASRVPASGLAARKQPSHSPKKGHRHPEYSQHDCQHTNPKTRCISIEPPPWGTQRSFLFFLSLFSFLFFLSYIHVSRSEP